MLDELKFAVKCGGSSKKVQLSSAAAVPIKETAYTSESCTNLNKKPSVSSSTGNLTKKIECKKCQEIIHNELLDNITSDNALVCKHKSASSLSILNPGLLIVEKEATIDAQAALLNSHVVPHSHLHISHQQAKQVYLEQVQAAAAVGKSSKSPKSRSGGSRFDMEDSDYILMQPLNNKNQMYEQSRLNLAKGRKQQVPQAQEIPIIINNKQFSCEINDDEEFDTRAGNIRERNLQSNNKPNIIYKNRMLVRK